MRDETIKSFIVAAFHCKLELASHAHSTMHQGQRTCKLARTNHFVVYDLHLVVVQLGLHHIRIHRWTLYAGTH